MNNNKVGSSGLDEPLAVPKRVKLPSGWAGLSFEVNGSGRSAVVTEVPKACFSSQRFEGAAGGQVEGVESGDIIAAINGSTPIQLAERIATRGDAFCACKDHEPGTKDKFAGTPCSSCDFLRRRGSLGISVALQLWLKTVKQHQEIFLTVWKKGTEPLEDHSSGPPLVEPCASKGVVTIGTNTLRKLPDGLDKPLGAMPKGAEGLDKPLGASQQRGLAHQLSKNKLAAAAQHAAAAARQKLDAVLQARQTADAAAQVAAAAAAKQATEAAAQALSFARDATNLARKRKLAEAERRLDGDGKAYTLAEFIALYGGSENNPPAQWMTERRLDYDGQAYTLEDFMREYGGTVTDPPHQWKSAPQHHMLMSGIDL